MITNEMKRQTMKECLQVYLCGLTEEYDYKDFIGEEMTKEELFGEVACMDNLVQAGLNFIDWSIDEETGLSDGIYEWFDSDDVYNYTDYVRDILKDTYYECKECRNKGFKINYCE